VALLTRCEELDLVERRRSEEDRRRVEVHLKPRGEKHLQRLAALHEAELRSLQNTFRVTRITAFNEDQEAPEAESAPVVRRGRRKAAE
jgi:DNA-binding MarR family transcriptional regulator